MWLFGLHPELMIKVKRHTQLTIALLMVLLLGSITAWAATSATLNPTITAGGDNGDLVTSITPVGEAFSIAVGNANKISGVELYKVELGNAQFSNLVRMNILLTNAYDAGRVLSNPNSFIQIQIYYPGTGANQVTLNYDGSTAIPDTSLNAVGMLNKQSGSISLSPSVTGQTTFYILASIIVPGGAPPGQQAPQLTSLSFHLDVRLGALQ